MSITDTAPPPRLRLAFLDALRGLALVGMFVFHFTWDLGFFGFIPAEFPFSPEFMLFGHVVASTFIGLAGASLVLAARNGMNWRAFTRRLAMIVAAAVMISAVTWYVFPDSFIFFGILHCIAVASVVAAAFLRAPLWIVAAAAAAIIAAPLMFASQVFDAPLLAWVGLGFREPRTNDWRPVFPWVGFAIAGVGVMRVALAHGIPVWLAAWRAGNRASRALVWGGRHSLLIYLVHQPIFLALVYGASLLASPEEAIYRRACEAQCVRAGSEAAFCARACACATAKLKDQGLWRNVLRNSLDAADNDRFIAISRQCARDSAP